MPVRIAWMFPCARVTVRPTASVLRKSIGRFNSSLAQERLTVWYAVHVNVITSPGQVTLFPSSTLEVRTGLAATTQ